MTAPMNDGCLYEIKQTNIYTSTTLYVHHLHLCGRHAPDYVTAG